MNFISNIELPDIVYYGLKHRLIVGGWVIDANNVVEQLMLTIDNVQVACQFGIERPDVADAYPHFSNALSSGFQAKIPVAQQKDNLKIELKARLTDGTIFDIALKMINLRNFRDSEASVIFYNTPKKLLYPDECEINRLPSFTDIKPVFFIGEHESLISDIATALHQSLGIQSFPAFDHLSMLRNLLVVTKNTYDHEIKGNHAQLKEQINLVGIGNLDIYEVMNEIVSLYHDKFRLDHQDYIYGALPLKEGAELIPFLKKVYPLAKFIYVQNLSNNSATSAHVTSRNYSSQYICSILNNSIFSNDILVVDEQQLLDNKAHISENIAQFIGVNNNLQGTLLDIFNDKVISTEYRHHSKYKRYIPDLMHHDSEILATFKLDKLPSFPDERPIFVVGAGRSGTSALALALMEGADIPGWHEGHVFPFMYQLLNRLFLSWNRYYHVNKITFADSAITAPSCPDVYEVLNVVIRNVVRQCKKDVSALYWFDKTPDARMINSVPLLNKLYPNSNYIFMRRHPISFALSRFRKFKERPVASLNDWKECIETWDKVKIDLEPNHYQELDQKELTQSADNLLLRLSKLTNLSVEDQARIVEYLRTQRPEYSGGSIPDILFEDVMSDDVRKDNRRAHYFRLVDYGETYLDDTDWSDSVKDRFIEICGQLADKYGYRSHPDAKTKPDYLGYIARQFETIQYDTQNEIVRLTEQLTERDQQLQQRNLQQAELDRQFHQKNLQQAEQGQQLAERDQQLAERDQQLAERDQQLAMYKKAYEKRTVTYWLNVLQNLLKRIFAR